MRPKHYANYEKDMSELVPGVFLSPGEALHIVDDEGEACSWTVDEWGEDPEAVTAAITAAVIAAAKGSAAVRENIKMGGTVLQAMLDETQTLVRGKPVRVRSPVVPYAIRLMLNSREAINGAIKHAYLDEIDRRAREIDATLIRVVRGGVAIIWRGDEITTDGRLRTLIDCMLTDCDFGPIESRWTPNGGWTHTLLPK